MFRVPNRGMAPAVLDVETEVPQSLGRRRQVDDAEDDVAEPGAQAHRKAPPSTMKV